MAVFYLDHHENDIRPVSIDTAWNFACGTVSDDKILCGTLPPSFLLVLTRGQLTLK